MADQILNPTDDPAKQVPSDDNQAVGQEPVKTDLTSQQNESVQQASTPSSDVANMAKPVVPPPVAPGTDANLAKPKESLPQTPPQPAASSDKAGEEVKPTVPTSIPPVSNSVTPGNDTAKEPVAPVVQDVPKPVEKTEVPEQKAAQGENVSAPANLPTSVTSAQPAETPAQAPASDDLKKTHEPIIVLPDRLEMGQTVDVKVRVGMVPHVMEDKHFIQSIELFANDQSVGKVDLNPKDNPNPEANFQVSLTAGLTLKAVAYCNVHGKWEGTRSV